MAEPTASPRAARGAGRAAPRAPVEGSAADALAVPVGSPPVVAGGLYVGRKWLALPAVLALVLAGFAFVPPAAGVAGIQKGIGVAAAAIAAFAAVLALVPRLATPSIAFESVKAHWVQAAVQACIYAWWGYHHHDVARIVPLVLAQSVYLYALLGLISFARGRTWRIGFGPLPIVFSTNLLLWFKPEFYVWQFVMITIGALGKEFVTWKRDGRSTHIFNPSVFAQSTVALVLIATASTTEYTVGDRIAAAFEALPHAYLLIFVLGLIVQYNFSVTLVTFGATLALTLANLAYTATTGLYWFVSINIGATIFLGLHLLVTDPSTSPRTNTGRLIFGLLYGTGYFLLFRVFERFDIPLFWDKLLPVPILNLTVPWLERMTRGGFVGRIEVWWKSFDPKRANLVHMGVWSALFLTLLGTGFIGGTPDTHPGGSLSFWREAWNRGDARAGEVLLRQARYGALFGEGDQLNTMGTLHLDGRLVPFDPARAADYFARSCASGHVLGCENTLGMYLDTNVVRSMEDLHRAIGTLEAECAQGGAPSQHFLLGKVFELGVARPRDPQRAWAYYTRAAQLGHPGAKALVETVRADARARQGADARR